MLLKLLTCIAVSILIPDYVRPDETVPCEAGWYYINGKCFRVKSSGNWKSSNWNAAVNECSTLKAELATVESPEENEFLTSVLLLEIESGAWIGLNDQRKEFNFEWQSGSNSSYRNWRSSEPNGGALENCVVLQADLKGENIGTWIDYICSYAMEYLCEKKSNPAYASLNPKYCSSVDGGGFRMRSSCYHLVTELKSWHEAEQHCIDNYDGHLITVLDKTVDIYLNYLYPDIKQELWIGLKIRTPFQQRWSSGWYAGYNGFKDEEPNFTEGTCVVRKGRKEWDMVPCSNKYAFICEKLLEKPPVLKPPPKDFICPSVPAGWRDLGGEFCYHIETSQTVSWNDAKCECRLREEFKWIDGSRLDFTNWYHKQPDNGDHLCVDMRTENMKWDDIDCNHKRHYICAVRKIHSPPTVTVTVESTGSVWMKAFIGVTVFFVLLVILCVIGICNFRSKYIQRKKSAPAVIDFQPCAPAAPHEIYRPAEILREDSHYEFMDG